jgi:hypothetical protein
MSAACLCRRRVLSDATRLLSLAEMMGVERERLCVRWCVCRCALGTSVKGFSTKEKNVCAAVACIPTPLFGI